MSAKSKNTLRVQQVGSAIGSSPRQRRILEGLGLRKMQSVVELPDNEATRGAVAKIPHLVRIVEEAS